jgi:Holliday junction resolvase
MTVIGDAAEREVAEVLARAGFELVYQSRASRGSFDLLATRGAHQLGVQVKRSPLPLRFDRATWQRMHADAKRLGWRWVVASVSAGSGARFLDPGKARRGKEVRLTEAAIIDGLVAWLEGAPRAGAIIEPVSGERGLDHPKEPESERAEVNRRPIKPRGAVHHHPEHAIRRPRRA